MMSQKNNALRGYGQVKRQTASDKNIELQLFSSITARLIKEKASASEPLTPQFAQALVDNAKLWNIIFLDLTHADNKLPLSLKVSLIELSEFTQFHTQQVLRRQANAEALIDVNKNIMAGLKESMRAKMPAMSPYQSIAQQEVA